MELTFPPEEHEALRTRLGAGKSIFTTRILREKGRYLPGMTIKTPFGELRVVSVKEVPCLSEHPFMGELTSKHVRDLTGHEMDLIELKGLRAVV